MKRLLHKRITRKGFTLAELLIVVAILAILVAISIPIFTTKLADAKQTTDDANMRAARALAANCVITGEFPEESWSPTIVGGKVFSYLAYYDAEKGCLRKSEELNNIKGYGQGSTYTDMYGNPATVKKGDVIAITCITYEDDNPEIIVYWYDPSTT